MLSSPLLFSHFNPSFSTSCLFFLSHLSSLPSPELHKGFLFPGYLTDVSFPALAFSKIKYGAVIDIVNQYYQNSGLIILKVLMEEWYFKHAM